MLHLIFLFFGNCMQYWTNICFCIFSYGRYKNKIWKPLKFVFLYLLHIVLLWWYLKNWIVLLLLLFGIRFITSLLHYYYYYIFYFLFVTLFHLNTHTHTHYFLSIFIGFFLLQTIHALIFFFFTFTWQKIKEFVYKFQFYNYFTNLITLFLFNLTLK